MAAPTEKGVLEEFLPQPLDLAHLWPLEFNNLAHMRRLLSELGVPLKKWGKKKAKGLNDLWEEIQAGETLLFLNTQTNEIVREIHPVLITIYHDAGYGVGRIALAELSRSGGKSAWKRWSRYSKQKNASLSEKKRSDETPIEAAIRGLQEELGIYGLTPDEKSGFLHGEAGDYYRGKTIGASELSLEQQFDILRQMMDEQSPAVWRPEPATSSPSTSYPGFKTHYVRHIFEYVLPNRLIQWRYFERTKDGRKFIFGWRPTKTSARNLYAFYIWNTVMLARYFLSKLNRLLLVS